MKAEVDLKFAEMEAIRRQQEQQQGYGRPIISICHKGYRFVAVGGSIHYSNKWKTFHDFLMDYLKIVMGEEWGTKELKKDLEQRHPILQWYDIICRYQQKKFKEHGKVTGTPMTGAIGAYMGLSYNLYLLAHNNEIQKKMIKRLQDPNHFTGAYYETVVAAILIKAGFELEFENENDTQTSHCEFAATFKETGKSFSVEAKAREPYKSTANITNQLYNALKKKANHPRVVFIEINVPETADDPHDLKWLQGAIRGLRSKEDNMTIDGLPASKAYLFVTNHPHQYYLQTAGSSQFIIGEGFKIPDFKTDFTCPSIREALHIREKHYEMFKIIESQKEHSEIPSTFEGEIPEFAFGDIPIPRLKIGKKYTVPQKAQREVIGRLKDACVSVKDKIVFGIYELKDGKQIIATCPMTENEVLAYQKYPDTFFGIYRPKGLKTKDALDMYDFFFEVYKDTPKEKLLELLQAHPDIEKLRQESQRELAITYCERLVYATYKPDPTRKPLFG
jgi:hypothetical protein